MPIFGILVSSQHCQAIYPPAQKKKHTGDILLQLILYLLSLEWRYFWHTLDLNKWSLVFFFFLDQHLTVIVFQFGQIQKGFLTKKKQKNVQFKNTARASFFLIKNIDQNQARLTKYLSEISCCVALLISYGCPVVHNTTGFQQAFLKYQGHRRSHRWILTINNTAVKQAQTWSADVAHSPTSCFYS